MNKTTLPPTIAIIGEILVVIGAAGWMSHAEAMKYIFATGTTLMAIGRFATTHDDNSSTTLRRLYRQQHIGIIMLIVAAILMFTYNTLNGIDIAQYTLHTTPAAWLLPFMIFVAIELYTAIRIPAELNKQTDK